MSRELGNRLALLNFLKIRRVSEGAGALVHFKINAPRDEWYVLDEQFQQLAVTTREATMLYIMSYPVIQLDPVDGYELWRMELEVLKNPPAAAGFVAMQFTQQNPKGPK